MKDIIIRDYEGIDIIPGSSGVEQMANLEADEINYLVGLFSALDKWSLAKKRSILKSLTF